MSAEAAQLMTHVALVLLQVHSNGAEAELGSPAWVLRGVPVTRRHLPRVAWGHWGWQGVRGGAHVLLMMWNFSPFWKVRSSSVLAS